MGWTIPGGNLSKKKTIDVGVNVHVSTLLELGEEASQLISGARDGELVSYLNIPPGKMKLTLTYPLGTPASMDFKVDDSTTVGDVLWIAAKFYEKVYDEEDSWDTPSSPDERTGLLNRERTSGPYGIWGHDIGDLWFEGIRIDGRKITLCMGS